MKRQTVGGWNGWLLNTGIMTAGVAAILLAGSCSQLSDAGVTPGEGQPNGTIVPTAHGTLILSYVVNDTSTRYDSLGRNGTSIKIPCGELEHPIIVSRIDQKSVSAVYAPCTHDRCDVGVVSGNLQCPCCFSLFDKMGGALVSGSTPAKDSLTHFQAVLDTMGKIITVTY